MRRAVNSCVHPASLAMSKSIMTAMRQKRDLINRKRRGSGFVVRRAAAIGGLPHGRLIGRGVALPCALGRSGVTGWKREGDGATPRGSMSILSGHFRKDRVLRLPGAPAFWRTIQAKDGWCDAPAHPAYNRLVSLPFNASHEVMTREDHLYDRLIVLDWNITRRARWRGSAIFLHQARIEAGIWKPTAGCIALEKETFRRRASRLAQLSAITVL